MLLNRRQKMCRVVCILSFTIDNTNSNTSLPLLPAPGDGERIDPKNKIALIWLKASLQHNCNKEGFNVIGSNNRVTKARICIVSNHDCNSCGSTIGFGTGGLPVDCNTCGDVTKHSPDNGDKAIKAMGYILVQ